MQNSIINRLLQNSFISKKKMLFFLFFKEKLISQSSSQNFYQNIYPNIHIQTEYFS